MLQIHEQVRKFCDRSQYGCIKLYERISSSYLQREHDSRCDILVTTPGRLTEFLFKEYVHPNKLRYVVLDENPYHVFTLMSRQNLLFSSTFSPEAQQYFRKWVKENILTIRNNGINHVNRNIIHTFICVDGVSKNRMCGDIIDTENEMANSFVLPSRKTLVFCWKVKNKEKALNALRSGNINVLVVTNVLARGMDISDLNHVMIVDLLNDFKTFIHRVGRTEGIKEGDVTTL
uniref:Helicase C-terminal domain-containing protein n=1 Tax=Strongyloides venezuelensis TaxID=75913 RepID=A0A0K0F057_STRVS